MAMARPIHPWPSVMSELSEAASDHAAAHRHREPTFAPAQSSVLHSVNVAIALSQTLRPAEAVGRAVAYSEPFEAEPATGHAFREPKLSASGSALRAAKIGPRATVREFCMGDADEPVLLAERYERPLVLKPDHARGLEARYADANEFIEEDAAVRVASAFRHEFKATPRPSRVWYYDTTCECPSI